ncbi:MAG: bifunctional hydroxymethylpyrimidine kinase/phosphomethylpyrimidine kinase [Bacteroidia bacterium]|nr:bifunctional hydroxymethylpyrimidine kinase/phosphomethylpyrimidine kinase [Bacteroidia bacterium]
MSIAGSDSGGGAGIQADIKTISALGCYATTAITAITVQNTRGVSHIHSVPPEIVEQQIEAILSDMGSDTIKIGMLHNVQIIRAVARTLKKYMPLPVVLDPVMVATSGHKLIEDHTIDTLQTELFPLATIITPNLDEAEILAGQSMRSLEAMLAASRSLLRWGNQAVLLKGGHLAGEMVYDIYLAQSPSEPKIFESPKIHSRNLHGSGCTLSSAIASFLALGLSREEAVVAARQYVYEAIRHGKDYQLGEGAGPLNHFYSPKILQSK